MGRSVRETARVKLMAHLKAQQLPVENREADAGSVSTATQQRNEGLELDASAGTIQQNDQQLRRLAASVP